MTGLLWHLHTPFLALALCLCVLHHERPAFAAYDGLPDHIDVMMPWTSEGASILSSMIGVDKYMFMHNDTVYEYSFVEQRIYANYSFSQLVINGSTIPDANLPYYDTGLAQANGFNYRKQCPLLAFFVLPPLLAPHSTALDSTPQPMRSFQLAAQDSFSLCAVFVCGLAMMGGAICVDCSVS